MSILYVVATPIGNLEDITLRALRILKEVRLIAAEDTRVTRRLLERYDIKTPLISYHEHNKRAKLTSLLESLGDADIALVSDAGMPTINDPGDELVRAAVDAGHEVVSIPGPSALTSALSISGIAAEQFVYLGFLPRKRSERKRLFESLVSETRVLIALETPHRIRAALLDMSESLGERRLAVCRELTKIHEEVFRGTASEALEYFSNPKGEFTLVIEGGEKTSKKPSDGEIQALLKELQNSELTAKQAVGVLIEKGGFSRREAYRLWLSNDGNQEGLSKPT